MMCLLECTSHDVLAGVYISWCACWSVRLMMCLLECTSHDVLAGVYISPLPLPVI